MRSSLSEGSAPDRLEIDLFDPGIDKPAVQFRPHPGKRAADELQPCQRIFLVELLEQPVGRGAGVDQSRAANR